PFYLENSPSVCFRHSDLYWRLLPPSSSWPPHFNRDIAELTRDNFIVIKNDEEDHFHARLRIYFQMNDQHRLFWPKFTGLRLSIFEIDQAMFRYIQGGYHNRSLPNCSSPDKMGHAFELADLFNSDHVNKFLTDHTVHHLDANDPLELMSLSEHCIMKAPERLNDVRPNYNYIKAHYDIRHIYHSRSDERRVG